MLKIESMVEFATAYRAKLEKGGLERIRKEMENISATHGGKPLALVCFEDLSKPGEWCHRRIFAVYWFEKTGDVVEELPSRRRATPQPPLQEGLF
jgi:hypothetical protein